MPKENTKIKSVNKVSKQRPTTNNTSSRFAFADVDLVICLMVINMSNYFHLKRQ